jgi:hypothetical protein
MTAGALFLVMALESGDRKVLFLCSLCAAFAMLIKTVALPVVLLECLFIACIRTGQGRLNDSLKDYATFLLPMIITASLTCSYFAMRGGFEDFYYWNIEFPSQYKSSRVTGPTLSYILMYLASTLAFPVTLTFFSFPWFWTRRRTLTALFTLMLIPASWWVVALPGKYFPHYFINIIPFLSIPAGMALAQLFSQKNPVSFLCLAVATVILGFSININYPFYTEYSPKEVSMAKYGTNFVNAEVVAEYIREHTGPDDYIFQWGLEPEIYFLADRRSPVPYITSVAVGWSKDPELARKKLLEALLIKRPKYIVFQDEWSDWPGVEEVQLIVSSYYVLDHRVPFGFIARRKDLPA